MKFQAEMFIASFQNAIKEPSKYPAPMTETIRDFVHHFGAEAIIDSEFRYGLALAGGTLRTLSALEGVSFMNSFNRLMWAIYGLSFGAMDGPYEEAVRWESLQNGRPFNGDHLLSAAADGPFPVFINQLNNPMLRTLDYRLDVTVAHYKVFNEAAMRSLIKIRKPALFLKYGTYLNGVQVDETLADTALPNAPRSFRRMINLED